MVYRYSSHERKQTIINWKLAKIIIIDGDKKIGLVSIKWFTQKREAEYKTSRKIETVPTLELMRQI